MRATGQVLGSPDYRLDEASSERVGELSISRGQRKEGTTRGQGRNECGGKEARRRAEGDERMCARGLWSAALAEAQRGCVCAGEGRPPRASGSSLAAPALSACCRAARHPPPATAQVCLQPRRMPQPPSSDAVFGCAMPRLARLRRLRRGTPVSVRRSCWDAGARSGGASTEFRSAAARAIDSVSPPGLQRPPLHTQYTCTVAARHSTRFQNARATNVDASVPAAAIPQYHHRSLSRFRGPGRLQRTRLAGAPAPAADRACLHTSCATNKHGRRELSYSRAQSVTWYRTHCAAELHSRRTAFLLTTPV
jgi:hypothetical protein